jgi:hypothetical protein
VSGNIFCVACLRAEYQRNRRSHFFGKYSPSAPTKCSNETKIELYLKLRNDVERVDAQSEVIKAGCICINREHF